MGEMQVHITAWLIMAVMLLTSIVQPFGKQKLLQFLELGTLWATWMTLWAGTVFNSYPRCEDGEGGTVGWCDTLSVLVGLVDIAMVFVAIVVVVYLTKRKECDACCGRLKDETVGQRRRESVARETERRKSRMDSKEVTSFVNPTLDLEKRNAVPELGSIEMTSSSSENAHESANGSAGEGKGEEKGEEKGNDGEEGEGGGEVTVTLETNSMHATRAGAAVTAPETVTPNAARARWNTLKQATRASRAFRRGGKQRMKRLSRVMKARQHGPSDDGGHLMGEEMKTVLDVEAAVTMHVDAETGRRYRYDAATGQTQWLSDDDGASEATHEEAREGEQQTKKLFRKFVDDDDDVYYENMETGEVVWDMPGDGELVEL